MESKFLKQEIRLDEGQTFVAFVGTSRLALGALRDVVRSAKEATDAGTPALVFENQTGMQFDFDMQGSPEQVLARLESDPRFAVAQIEPPRSGPGRPKLGVVSREISLLKKHWDWLEMQPNGASAALRKLVEADMKTGKPAAQARQAIDATAKFLWAMAGDLPSFEESTRALYAKDFEKVDELALSWPTDIREHTKSLTQECARLQSALSKPDNLDGRISE